MTMTDETLGAIPAMLRAAEVMQLASQRLRTTNDSRDPYVAKAAAEQARDAQALRQFAQTVCLHPDAHYARADDLQHRSHCELCGKVWAFGEGREVAA